MVLAMSAESENLMLEHLRHIRGELSIMKADLHDLKMRVGAVETHVATLSMSMAQLNTLMDRFDERLARVEWRLGLIDA